MTSERTNYFTEALSDAWAMAENFEEEMIEQWKRNGEISNDLYNDFEGGDDYHHSTHVDKDYRLKEASDLLDELSEWEEDDTGLWQGLEPRRAIAAQAAYTYGNAVYDLWRRHCVDPLNDLLNDIEEDDEIEDEEEREEAKTVVGTRIIRVFLFFGEDFAEEGERRSLERAAWEEIKSGGVTGCLALADWYAENGEESRALRLRECVK